MPSIQSLKKQLRGIRSTQKLTKAMKTIATVKFSKLNTLYNNYSEYGKQCERIFENYGADIVDSIFKSDLNAPIAFIVIASNKGLCGNFNTELLKFACEKMQKFDNYLLFACGKKAINFFKAKNMPVEKEYILNDIPSYDECCSVIDDILEMQQKGKVSEIHLIYPEYINVMRQKPVLRELFASDIMDKHIDAFCIPDKNTIIEKITKTVFHSMFYGHVLEAATGAQAATLMTMRSAYDTATEYLFMLEGQINRKRQSAVTADVIETSSERSE